MNTPQNVCRVHADARRQHVTRLVRPALVLFSFLALSASPLPVDGKGKPGGPGGPGGGPKPATPQILPVSLGAPADCSTTEGLNLNSGGNGLTVVGTGWCLNAHYAAVRWSPGFGMQYIALLPGSTGNTASAVSDDGTIVGWAVGTPGQAFVLEREAAVLQRLEPLPGMLHARADSISRQGRYIVGVTSTDTEFHGTAWTRNPAGAWQPVDLGIGSCDGVPGVADDGTTIVNIGTVAHTGRIGSALLAALPGTDTVARAINSAGDWIVGYRLAPCTAPCSKYPVPVYWTLQGSSWSGPVDLPALDGVDSEALGIAERSGAKLIVGYGYTNKDGIMRAVAWMQDGSSFRLQRLAAIDGKGRAFAWASAVNDAGQVTGTSQGSGLARFAVLWQLP